MTVKTTNGVTTFTPNCSYQTAPKIIDTFMDDEGRKVYVLDNSRTSLADTYDSLWNPVKGKCNFDKKYKGENLDTRKIK